MLSLRALPRPVAERGEQAPPGWPLGGAHSLGDKLMNPRAATVVVAIVIGAILGITAGTLLARSANHHSSEPPGFNKVGAHLALAI